MNTNHHDHHDDHKPSIRKLILAALEFGTPLAWLLYQFVIQHAPNLMH